MRTIIKREAVQNKGDLKAHRTSVLAEMKRRGLKTAAVIYGESESVKRASKPKRADSAKRNLSVDGRKKVLREKLLKLKHKV